MKSVGRNSLFYFGLFNFDKLIYPKYLFDRSTYTLFNNSVFNVFNYSLFLYSLFYFIILFLKNCFCNILSIIREIDKNVAFILFKNMSENQPYTGDYFF